MKNPIQSIIDQFGTVILDGATATEIERHGVDIKHDLWSAKALLDYPNVIQKVHYDYFKSGADIAITTTYQANIQAFIKFGVSEEKARQLIKQSVLLAKNARSEFWNDLSPEEKEARPFPLVAGSVGPYGAFLADGSEYRGDYSLSKKEFQDFHFSRLQLLEDAGVDLFAFETLPHSGEAQALVELLHERFPEKTAWVSFSISNNLTLWDGTPLEEAISFVEKIPQVVAVGINCTSLFNVSPALKKIKNASSKPIIVYPNSGETYEPKSMTWLHPKQGESLTSLSKEWVQQGASILGGCCRTTPNDIRGISELVRSFNT